MKLVYGISWNDSKKGNMVGLFSALVLALSLAAVPAATLSNEMGRMVSVVVREDPGAGSAPEQIVRDLGGTVEQHIRIINGFVARVPEGVIRELVRSEGVHSVTPNGKVQLLQVPASYDPGNDLGSLYNLTRSIEAPEMWKKGFTGAGVGIALIDSGVVPVEGLTTPGKVVNGPDLSFDSQVENLRYLDGFGHGTHLAGIMAGRDSGVVSGAEDKKEYFAGVAPAAHIVNVKVADFEGATDVSQVIAAIDWVVQHRNDPGLNIRVLNLSFGTDGTQDYRLDPLSYAAEVAWRKGIVVVVAAGNSGYGSSKLNNPAFNPHVLAVGAIKANGTPDTNDDTVPDWSSRGDGTRNPDVVAPGQSVTSLRAPGSYLDQNVPTAVSYGRFFRGSGTSQAAAVVSGAAALAIQQRPSATPDQIKKLLMSTTTPLPAADSVAQGSGLVNMKKLLDAPTPSYVQPWEFGTGLGSLHLARGSVLVYDDGVALEGEQDIFGSPWDGNSWSGNSWSGNSWSGGMWNGNSWSGNSWSGNSWSGNSWSGNSWSGNSWSGNSWSGNSWSGNSWSGNSWSGNSWSGNSWSGNSWSGNSWSGNSWSGNSWSGNSWSGNSWSSALWGE